MHSKVVKFDHLKFDGLRGMGHKDKYVGSLVYRESVVPVPMILLILEVDF